MKKKYHNNILITREEEKKMVVFIIEIDHYSERQRHVTASFYIQNRISENTYIHAASRRFSYSFYHYQEKKKKRFPQGKKIRPNFLCHNSYNILG